jgi:molybdopterin converting factor subunit 1
VQECRGVKIQIRLFAHMAAQAGVATVSVDLPPGSKAAAVEPLLKERFPEMRWVRGTLLALNQAYAGGEEILRDHDEVAVIPPVSGG